MTGDEWKELQQQYSPPILKKEDIERAFRRNTEVVKTIGFPCSEYEKLRVIQLAYKLIPE